MGKAFDLYEFPEGYAGRKNYVSVRGHKRSIPRIYTYTGTDSRYHVLPEYGGSYDELPFAHVPAYVPDMVSYQSPVDGSMISSRSQHREHLKAHELIEVGNEKFPERRNEMSSSGELIKHRLDEVRCMSEREYRNYVEQQRSNYES